MLVGVGLVAALLAVGLVMSVWYAVNIPDSTFVNVPGDTGPTSVRDVIAAAPMVSLEPEAGFTPDPATAQLATISIPTVTRTGPADVATGFPQTPEGAIGQLAAIERAVLEEMSLPHTRAIHQAWVQPGGPTFEDWEMTHSVQAFLASTRQRGQAKDPETSVIATPAAAIVKGTDGPTWTVSCVLLDITAWVQDEARMGYGHCARMEWIEGRWQIADGAAPAQAPSAWPGSNAAAEAGWRTWTEE